MRDDARCELPPDDNQQGDDGKACLDGPGNSSQERIPGRNVSGARTPYPRYRRVLHKENNDEIEQASLQRPAGGSRARDGAAYGKRMESEARGERERLGPAGLSA